MNCWVISYIRSVFHPFITNVCPRDVYIFDSSVGGYMLDNQNVGVLFKDVLLSTESRPTLGPMKCMPVLFLSG
jgi:hypothetical protein